MKSLRVGFDDQVFSTQVRGGISRYFVNLFLAMQNLDGVTPCLIPEHPLVRNQHLLEAHLGQAVGAFTRPVLIRARNLLRRRPDDLDVVHHTHHYRSYLYRHPRPRVRATTVYDMIPELFPEHFERNPHHAKRRHVMSADVVFCISESTRRDLVRIYGRPPGHLVVTHLAVSEQFRPDAAVPPGLPERYVLFIGDRDRYKDFALLAQAFARASLPPDVHLVAVGGKPLTPEFMAAMRHLGIEKRFTHALLTDDQLPGAYASSECFVFPSRYEGFGLPTLEAMASGTPVIVANAASHPEVAGDAAYYFEPGDSDGLIAALEDVILGNSSARDLRRRGLARAAHFTWRATAEATLAGYRRVLQ